MARVAAASVAVMTMAAMAVAGPATLNNGVVGQTAQVSTNKNVFRITLSGGAKGVSIYNYTNSPGLWVGINFASTNAFKTGVLTTNNAAVLAAGEYLNLDYKEPYINSIDLMAVTNGGTFSWLAW